MVTKLKCALPLFGLALLALSRLWTPSPNIGVGGDRLDALTVYEAAPFRIPLTQLPNIASFRFSATTTAAVPAQSAQDDNLVPEEEEDPFQVPGDSKGEEKDNPFKVPGDFSGQEEVPGDSEGIKRSLPEALTFPASFSPMEMSELYKKMDASDNAKQVVDDAYKYSRTGVMPGLYENCETSEEEHEPYDVAQNSMSYVWVHRDYAKLYSCVSCALENDGIHHWAMEGNLLGLARNGTFIPWDGDLDMGILVTDVDRLDHFDKSVNGEPPALEWHVSKCSQCRGFSLNRIRSFFQKSFDWFPHLPTRLLNSSPALANYIAGTGCNAYPASLWPSEQDIFPLQRCKLKDISAVVPECGAGAPVQEYTVLCPNDIDTYMFKRGFGRRQDWMQPRPPDLFRRFMNTSSKIRQRFIARCLADGLPDHWERR